MVQEDRVYLFLDGLDDRLDNVRADVLQMQPFPTVEQAYARVRREDMRQAVMMAHTDTTNAAAMVSHGRKMTSRPPVARNENNALQMVSASAASGGVQYSTGLKARAPPQVIGGCTHCGNSKHTKETCFKLHGYPDWWKELQAKKKTEKSTGKG